MNVDSYKTLDPVARRAMMTEVLRATRPMLKEIVQKLLPKSLHHDGRQIAALGALVALEKYDPTAGIAFEDVVRFCARVEIAEWLRRGDDDGPDGDGGEPIPDFRSRAA